MGQYRVIAELARGQHSVVYKAWQASLERHVALKVLHDYDQRTLQKFQDEARLTAQLIQQGVPHIRQVYEVGQTEEGYLFVALEYIDDSLQNLLRRARERNRRMSPLAAARLLQPIAAALDAVHRQGWVHLDVKPQNILIARGGRAMLADFGIAQRRGVETHACTPAYASPEQAAGDRPVGPWSDIYSLAVVFYEMVAGHPPVRGDHDFVLLNQHLTVTPPSPRKVNPRLTAAQERALYKALAKSPRARFATAGEFIQAMAARGDRLSGRVPTPGSMRSAGRGQPGRWPRWAVVGGLVALLLGLVALLTWLLGPSLLPRRADATPTSAPASISTARLPAAVGTPAMLTASPRPAPTRTPTPSPPPTVTLAPSATSTRRPTRTPRPPDTPTPEATP